MAFYDNIARLENIAIIFGRMYGFTEHTFPMSLCHYEKNCLELHAPDQRFNRAINKITDYYFYDDIRN